MTPEFPQCPACQQASLYPPDGGDALKCASCGHAIRMPRESVLNQALHALVQRFGGNSKRLEQHWETKLADERAKVARLAEGRW